MNDPTAIPRIQGLMRRTQVGHRIRILCACESGSRAWRFASPDSDYEFASGTNPLRG